MTSPRSRSARDFADRLAVRPHVFDSRRSIEHYVDSLNESSTLAQRRITKWNPSRVDSLRLAAIPLAAGATPAADAFLGEADISFAMDVQARGASPASDSCTVGLVLAGSMHLTLAHGECTVGPAQGVIIDPAEVERTRFAAGTHFLEFALPKACLRRLGAQPESPCDAAPRFAPLLRGDLPQRLLILATQAAGALQTRAGGSGPPMQFQRWTETIALTLLQEQPRRDAGQRLDERAALPARLRRAIDFIEAQAHTNIELADVAMAACLSASSLLRQFKQHLGLSPGAFLRGVRLEHARADLRRGDAGSVREVAERWGFLNASKFAQAYLRRFGELPRHALARD